jgi:hypothetical protein
LKRVRNGVRENANCHTDPDQHSNLILFPIDLEAGILMIMLVATQTRLLAV